MPKLTTKMELPLVGNAGKNVNPTSLYDATLCRMNSAHGSDGKATAQ